MIVKFAVEGRFCVEVNNVSTVKEALEKAREAYYDADFGELEDIDCEPVYIEDDNDVMIDSLNGVGVENIKIANGRFVKNE